MTDHTLEDLGAFNDRMAKMPARRAELIAEARAAGHTWEQIGGVLGMTVHGAIKASKPAAPRGRPRASTTGQTPAAASGDGAAGA